MKRNIISMMAFLAVVLLTMPTMHSQQREKCGFGQEILKNNRVLDGWHVNTLPYDQQGTYDNNEYCFTIYVHLVRDPSGNTVNASTVNSRVNAMRSEFGSFGINLNWDDPINYITNNSLHNNPHSAFGSSYSDNSRIDIYFFKNSGNYSSASSLDHTAIVMRPDDLTEGVLAHEMGHQFGLFHTFHGTYACESNGNTFGACENNDGFPNDARELVNMSNGAVAGDWVRDTPADAKNHDGQNFAGTCVYYDDGGAADTNGDPYFPDATNFMSYFNDDCRDNFTGGQQTRMKHVIEAEIIPHLLDAMVSCTTDPDPCEICDSQDEEMADTLSSTFIMDADCMSATLTKPPGIFLNKCESNFSVSWDNGIGFIDYTDPTTYPLVMDFSSGDNSTYSINVVRDEATCGPYPYDTGCTSDCGDCQDIVDAMIADIGESPFQVDGECTRYIFTPPNLPGCYTGYVIWGDSPFSQAITFDGTPMSHTYTEAGEFPITITLGNSVGTGICATETETFTVVCNDCENPCPLEAEINFLYEPTTCTYQFFTTEIDDSCLPGDIQYLWTVSEVNAEHTTSSFNIVFPENGSYKVSLSIAYLLGTQTLCKDNTFEIVNITCAEAKKEPELVMFPNPAKQGSELVISGMDSKEILGIQILSLEGQVVQSIKNGTNIFALSKLKSGLYFVSIQTNYGTQIKRLILE